VPDTLLRTSPDKPAGDSRVCLFVMASSRARHHNAYAQVLVVPHVSGRLPGLLAQTKSYVQIRQTYLNYHRQRKDTPRQAIHCRRWPHHSASLQKPSMQPGWREVARKAAIADRPPSASAPASAATAPISCELASEELAARTGPPEPEPKTLPVGKVQQWLHHSASVAATVMPQAQCCNSWWAALDVSPTPRRLQPRWRP